MKIAPALTLAALLASCVTPSSAGESTIPENDYVYEYKQTLSDGREVTCLVYTENRVNAGLGGMSCDWAGATSSPSQNN